MEKEAGNKIRLGLFVTAAALSFIIAVYYIGSKKNLFSSTFRISALFSNVSGLQAGNNVRYAGIDVGTVNKVQILNDSMVEVQMIIDDEVQKFIKKDAAASIGTDGLMGNRIVNIISGSLNAPPVQEGDRIAVIQPLETDAMLRTLVKTNENAEEITINVKDITHNINTGKGLLWKLMKDTAMGVNFEESLLNIRNTTREANRSATELRTLIMQARHGNGTVSTLINDTAIAGKLRQTITSLDSAGQKLAQASEEISAIATRINDPNKTFGRIISDTTVAGNISSSLKNIHESSESFKQNMEALKHSWPFKRYFRKTVKK